MNEPNAILRAASAVVIVYDGDRQVCGLMIFSSAGSGCWRLQRPA